MFHPKSYFRAKVCAQTFILRHKFVPLLLFTIVHFSFSTPKPKPICVTTITNSSFATAIRNVCPTCINASNQLTSVAESTTFISFSNQSITDITGIDGFLALQNLNVNSNLLTFLPNSFPPNLQILNCNNNPSILLNNLPNSLLTLDVSSDNLSALPTLPNGITTLNCSFNKITTINSLPTNLLLLNCSNNSTADGVTRYLTSLPATLPTGLTYLDCSRNDLLTLPSLPSGLTNLYCYSNHRLSFLPTLQNLNSLTTIYCLECAITVIPTLPPNLKDLECQSNALTNNGFQGTNMSLPSGLTTLLCQGNVSLTRLPILNAGLTLQIDEDHVNCLPNIPSGLTVRNKVGTVIPPPPLCSTLPLNWIDFQAKINTLEPSSNVSLFWVTAQEINVKDFFVERSADGINFQAISNSIKSANSILQTNYNYTDTQPLPRISYYRIKESDFDGIVNYSLVRSISPINSISPIKDFTFFPNPAKNSIWIDLKNYVGNDITITISDFMGRTIQTEKINVNTAQSFNLDVSQNATGLYFLKIQTSNQEFLTKKLQVTR